MKPLSQTRQAIVEEFREKLLEKTVFHQKTKDFEIANELSKLPTQLSNDLTQALKDYTESIVRMVEGKKVVLKMDDACPFCTLQKWDCNCKARKAVNQALNDIKEELSQ